MEKKMSKIGSVKIFGVIHARGGSTRIPLKNIKLLDGKPLISYMIKAALDSELLERVIVSTDHLEIKRVSLEYGAEVPFYRPEDISWDCPSELVTQHAVRFVEKEQGEKVNMVVTMQPTTPFVMGNDIDECIKLLLSNPQWKSTFSAVLVRERPEWMFSYDETKSAKLIMTETLSGEVGISQTLPKLAISNGAVYVTRRDELFDRNVLISKETGIYLMPWDRSLDIDELIDFEFALTSYSILNK